jgi:hypothetical protein
VTQADLDGKGGGDTDIDNVATVTSNETGPDTDDAVAPLVYTPGIDLEKYVSVDGGVTFDDADSSKGLLNVNVGAPVSFKITVANTGNVSLTNVVITDVNKTGGLPGVPIDLTGVTIQESGVANGILDVGETWTLNYTQAFDPGEHLNTASVTTLQGVGDTDDAYYYSLINQGPGVGTPGFWGNLGGQFWNNVVGDETKAGANFPTGELVYAVDSNNDGFINSKAGDGVNDDKPLDAAGLLIGDYNKDGLSTGEDTLFIALSDAKQLINASQRTANADGVQMLGRDVVATWLNYLAGNNIGDAGDAKSPKEYINDAVDWLQTWGGKAGNGAANNLADNDKGESFDAYFAGHVAVKTSSAQWTTAQFAGDPTSAAQAHYALDYYNNNGQTEVGGTQYAHDRDDAMFATALKLYQDSGSDLSSQDAAMIAQQAYAVA